MTPGGAQGLFPLLQHGVGTAVMDVIGGEHGDSAMAVLGVVPREERPAEGDGGVDIVESPGEAGVVLQGLELGLGEGVVIADLGAAQRASHPRSASSCAVHLLVMGAPRSECRVRTWGSMPCLRQVCSISVAARAAFSRSATIQPTT